MAESRSVDFLFRMHKSHDRSQRQRDRHHARTQSQLSNIAIRWGTHDGLLQIEFRFTQFR
ncbi:Uncharacterised protein [Vibrio cholerae]|nr:Uncharacterised protein [Vibrio cholerae]